MKKKTQNMANKRFIRLERDEWQMANVYTNDKQLYCGNQTGKEQSTIQQKKKQSITLSQIINHIFWHI